ncbi:hypothetical protein [Thermogutta sp.]|uniref:hypothetical protein n=1 Tax=Thermogutta sp. TaxID=1962930 RepID=UPI00321FE9B1
MIEAIQKLVLLLVVLYAIAGAFGNVFQYVYSLVSAIRTANSTNALKTLLVLILAGVIAYVVIRWQEEKVLPQASWTYIRLSFLQRLADLIRDITTIPSQPLP